MTNDRDDRDRSAASQLFRDGVALHGQGRLVEAQAFYLRALELDRDNAGATHLLGVVSAADGRFAQAAALLRRAAGLDGSSPQIAYDLAMVLSRLGRAGEAITSFDRVIALQPKNFAAHFNRGMALTALGRGQEAVISYDRAIAVRPGFAEAFCNRGDVLRGLGLFDDALASLDRAIALNPAIAEAHNNRGLALAELGRCNEAVASYDRAIALRPDFAQACSNRGSALCDLGRTDEALESCQTAIALDPACAEAYNNRGNALQDLGRGSDAMASFDEAIALRPGYHEAVWNKALPLLALGDLSTGWELYEARRDVKRFAGRRDLQQPQWSGREGLTGKTVFLHHEQGLGDTIQFCRYAPLVKSRGARVMLSVQDPLSRLLRTLNPGVDIIGAEAVPETFDLHCPLMSLPRAFRTTLDSIPCAEGYLSADPSLAGPWNARLPSNGSRRVGLAWSGAPGHKNDRNRSIALKMLEPLLTASVEWVCLQSEVRDSDREAFDRVGRIHRPIGEAADFAGTAAIIANLDLVITVDTSVAHLAGALGKPTWVLLPFVPDFRWLIGREDSPWYASVRLFRQPAIGDWPSVIARVRDALRRWLDID